MMVFHLLFYKWQKSYLPPSIFKASMIELTRKIFTEMSGKQRQDDESIEKRGLLVRQKRDGVAAGESVHRVSQQEVHIRSCRLSGAASCHFFA